MLLKNAKIYKNGGFLFSDLLIQNGRISKISENIILENIKSVDLKNKYILPGLADVHVHLREPGFSYKETIKTGTSAAAAGGFTALMSMPNLSPAPYTVENLKLQLDIIQKTAKVGVYPLACLTEGGTGRGELLDYKALSKFTNAFSDDGKGVQDENTMREIMRRIRELGGIVVAHCEDESLIQKGGCIHEGDFAKRNGFVGISSESEWGQIERDLRLVEETGVKYHVCHISTKESVRLIREAKGRGIDVTCETAPHYLFFTDEDILDDGRFKMNPPLRSSEDRKALIDGIIDGTIDMISTDHAPHSDEEKSKGLRDSAFGVVGLETSISAVYTSLVKTGKISMERLVELMSKNPRERFSLENADIEIGREANLMVFDPGAKYLVEPEGFKSMGKKTPFEGVELSGKCIMTLYQGEIIYEV
ncbi:dihydroorotase [Clostridiaceae bacterium OttesenSCG-928-D20]|nr:dihydroorotase [Clostridiaceae bacterium OttesenSCG-928-D20]